MRFLLGAAFALLISARAMAADGSSGCGPAWYIFKENSLLSSTLRGTTNGILWPVVTFGMTFGTSNCAKHSLVQEDQDSLKFMTENFEVLRHDIAKGEGEHLNAYIASFSCQPLVTKQLSSDLQKAYRDALYQSEDPVDYVNSTRRLIQASEASSLMCS